MLVVKEEFRNLETLQKYGFKEEEDGKFVRLLEDPDEPGKPWLVWDACDVPHLSITISKDDGIFYPCAVPDCSSTMEGDELDMVTHTIFQMTQDGILKEC